MSGKLRHIAISVPDPWAVAPFYEAAFGMKRLGETDSSLARGVYLSDGCITLALLNFKDDHHAGPLGRKHVGLHHIGFWVDEIGQATKDVAAAGGTYFLGEVPMKGNSFYEVKYFDPNGVMIDITDKGWGGSLKDVVAAGDATPPPLRDPGLKADRPHELGPGSSQQTGKIQGVLGRIAAAQLTIRPCVVPISGQAAVR